MTAGRVALFALRSADFTADQAHDVLHGHVPVRLTGCPTAWTVPRRVKARGAAASPRG